MVNFINDMRSELGVPNLLFVIATTGMDGWKDYPEVELAQLAMADPAAHPAFAGNVKTIDLRASYEGLEFWQSQDKSPASDSIHWHRNAKTYLNIGLAMADAMSLMAPARCPYRLKASGDGSGVTLNWQNGTDAITFSTKGAGGGLDEIRFGATYEDVIGAGGGTSDDYATWSAEYPDADLSDPEDDFDNDGLTNNEERIWGLDPTSGTSVNIYTAPFDASAGTFAYSRRNPSLSGASFAYVYSTTLAADGWLPLTPALEDARGTSPVESVTVTLPASLLENTRLFVRIIATEN